LLWKHTVLARLKPCPARFDRFQGTGPLLSHHAKGIHWRNPVGRPASQGTVDNINTFSRPTGTSIEYALRRLRADNRPIAKQLHTKVLAGELSAHRATILAGYRKEDTRMEQMQKLWHKLDPAERRTYRAFAKEAHMEAVQGLAANPDVTPMATEEQAKRLRAEGGKKGGRGRRNLDANGMKVSGSNSATYLVRRLKRAADEPTCRSHPGETLR
jgi:hypothetical protein